MAKDCGPEQSCQSETNPDVAAHFAEKLGFSENTQALDQMLAMPSIAFDVLSESQRRLIIRYLLNNESPVMIGELAAFVAARERQTSPVAVTSGEQNKIIARLNHIHLPKLVDFELIEWHPETDEIFLHTDDRSPTKGYEKTKREDDLPDSSESNKTID